MTSIYTLRPSFFVASWLIKSLLMLWQGADSQLYAQNVSRDKVRAMVIDIAKGKEQSVQAQLKKIDPAASSTDAGMMFVRALLEKNAVQAVTMLEDIVSTSPRSEWADDAQWRVVQIYAMKKDTTRAREELSVLQEKFAFSPFLPEAKTMVEFMIGTESGAQRNTVKRITDGTSIAYIKLSSSEAKKTDDAPGAKSTKKKSDEFVLPFKVVGGRIVANKRDDKESAEEISKENSKENVKSTSASEKKKSTDKDHSLEKDDKSIKQEKKSADSKKESTDSKKESTDSKKESTDSKKESSSKEEDEQSVSSFTMQVGVFKTEETAKAEQAKYTRMRMKTSLYEKEIAGEKVFAVLVGNYPTKADAETQRRLVQRVCNCPAFIVQK
jgi:cell division septation protein DedD